MKSFDLDADTVSVTIVPDGSDNYMALIEKDYGVILETGMRDDPDVSASVFLTHDLRERLIALLTAVKL